MRNLVYLSLVLFLAFFITPTAQAAQLIAIDSTTLHFEAENNGPLPVSSTFRFSINTGTNTFHTWSVSDDAAWLDESPGAGSETSPLSNDITISVNTTSLPPATYTGVITVTSSGVSNSPQTVDVTYVVSSGVVPTLTEWGMIIFSVLLFGWMARVMIRRRKSVRVGI